MSSRYSSSTTSSSGPKANVRTPRRARVEREDQRPWAQANEARAPFRVARGARRVVIYNQMVVELLSDDDVDRLFHALADSTRRDILRRAVEAEQSVSSLARHYQMSFAAVQKHVAVLERATLVTKEKRGREQIVKGHEPSVRQAQRRLGALEDLWKERAAQMAGLLAAEKGRT